MSRIVWILYDLDIQVECFDRKQFLILWPDRYRISGSNLVKSPGWLPARSSPLHDPVSRKPISTQPAAMVSSWYGVVATMLQYTKVTICIARTFKTQTKTSTAYINDISIRKYWISKNEFIQSAQRAKRIYLFLQEFDCKY